MLAILFYLAGIALLVYDTNNWILSAVALLLVVIGSADWKFHDKDKD